MLFDSPFTISPFGCLVLDMTWLIGKSLGFNFRLVCILECCVLVFIAYYLVRSTDVFVQLWLRYHFGIIYFQEVCFLTQNT